MTSFDDDICYCHDAACPKNSLCYRYVNRAWGTWASHAATLRDPETGRCEYFIPTTTTPARRAAASE